MPSDGYLLIFYILQYVFLFYFLVVALLYTVLGYLGIRSILKYYQRISQRSLKHTLEKNRYIPISILVPAYNEEKSIVSSVRSFLSLHYPEFEVIVASDGSQDTTVEKLIEAFELYPTYYVYNSAVKTQPVQQVYRSKIHPNLIVATKLNGGKGDAMNAALNMARYPLVCGVDADSLLDVKSLLRISQLFLEDETVVGVGATIRPLNGATIENGKIIELNLPDNWLARLQVLEYSRAFFSGRAGWASINALLIISGAFGLFRRDLMLKLEGWSDETITEDIELLLHIYQYAREHNMPHRIEFVPDPLCWTEVPTDMKSLRGQRNRWHRGLIEVLWTYRHMFFNPKYGTIGMLAIPYFWIVEAFSPMIELFGYVFVIVLIIIGVVDVPTVMLLGLMVLLYGILISQISMGAEALLIYRYNKVSDRLMLVALSVIEFMGYRQILLWERFWATFQVQKKRGQWGKMERKGFS